jgi:hypothetical protein
MDRYDPNHPMNCAPYPSKAKQTCVGCAMCRAIPAGHRCERFSWLLSRIETDGCGLYERA